jgi:DNA-binding transcriptional LysR family regulator
LLDVRRIRLLRELSIHGTVSATAAALQLTGPAVSQQLAALEREAGLPLLEKDGRRLRLTAAGRLLAEHAEVILGDLATAEADLQALRSGGGSEVRVAAFPSAARVLLPRIWDRDLRLRLTQCEPEQALQALRQDKADIALVHSYSLLPRDLPPGCEQHHLADDPVLLAVHPSLGLTPGEPADLRKFASQDWLLPGPDTSCHELARRACGAAGFIPRPVAVANDFAVITALVAAGAGVALVPRLALPDNTDGVSLHPLVEPVTRTIYAVVRIGDARQPQVSLVLQSLRAATRPTLPQPSAR